MKQLQIIHGAGFNETDRAEFVAVIRSNLLQATKSILAAMAILYIEFDTQVSTKYANHAFIFQ